MEQDGAHSAYKKRQSGKWPHFHSECAKLILWCDACVGEEAITAFHILGIIRTFCIYKEQ